MTRTRRPFRGFPVDELIDDFRLACVSRGHRRPRDHHAEAEPGVLPDLRRRPRGPRPGPGPPAPAGLRLVLPLLPRPGAGARPRRHAHRDPAAGRGLGRRPVQRRPPDAVALGQHGRATSSPSRARPAASASRPSAAPRPPATSCGARTARLHGPRRRAHLREPRRGRVQRGRVLGEPQHGLQPPPAGAVRGGRQRLRHLGADAPTSTRRRWPSWSPGFRGLEVHRLDGTDYFGVRDQAPLDHRARPGRRRPGADPRRRRPARTRTRRPTPRASTARSRSWPTRRARDPDRPAGARPRRAVACSRPSEAAEIRAEAREIVAKAAAEALAARRPDPATVTEHVVRAARPSPDPPDTYDGGEPVPFGEAIKRTLHELMAADERIRVFGEDVADAREAVLANVEGKGGVFGTTHGLQRAFGQARCFNTPLSEANIVGRAVGQAIRGLRPAPEIQFFDYIWPAMTQIKSEAATIRWRSNGAFTVPDGDAGADRRLPHRRGHLAQPVRRVDLRPRPRPARRLPVAGPRRRRAAAVRVPVRRPGAVPRAQAPAAPALHRRPVPAAPTT